MGVYSGSGRTADQSEFVLFWAGNTPLYWNRIAVQLSAKASLSFIQNARLFALLNITAPAWTRKPPILPGRPASTF